MTELLTAAQMRAIEQAAIDSGETTGLELMERAGAGVVEAILQEWPDMAKTPQKAVVLCGPGNNGGDGFVVARLLKARGWEVEVFLYGDMEKLPPDAKVNAERWLEVGGVGVFSEAPDSIERFPDICIDAVFGAGLSRFVTEDVAKILKCFSQQLMVSIDCETGMDLDSGRFLTVAGFAFSEAAIVVSFHRAKLGHFIGKPSYDQILKVVDIGLQQVWRALNGGVLRRNEIVGIVQCKRGKLRAGLFRGRYEAETHKYTHGHALILSGPASRTGAARLAARGALRIGAGVVSLGCPQEAAAECAAQLTAIMLAPIEDGAALKAVLQDTRINALCLGPAMGVDDRGRGLLEAAVCAEHAPYVVLDADGLTLLAQSPDLFGMLHEKCVLTPHAGEFKRLFPDIMAKLEAPAVSGPAYSKVDATREAAARAGCVVLFKGADTVIASPDGRAAINSAHYERAAPWLATAGSGDVLAGFITGLLARGFAPMQAAEAAAWVHVECALKFGPGLIAEDIPEQLPAVVRAFEL